MACAAAVLGINPTDKSLWLGPAVTTRQEATLATLCRNLAAPPWWLQGMAQKAAGERYTPANTVPMCHPHMPGSRLAACCFLTCDVFTEPWKGW